MAGFRTPFTDAASPRVSPSGPGVGEAEPNLPEGMPTRDGGLLAEKLRDPITPKKPSFVNPGESFKFGMKK